MVFILSATLYPHASFSLSCFRTPIYGELQSLNDIVRYNNIVEVKIIDTSYQDRIVSWNGDDKNKLGVVSLKFETIEVFWGSNIKTYSITNLGKRIAGALISVEIYINTYWARRSSY